MNDGNFSRFRKLIFPVGQTDRLPIANRHQRPSNDKEMSTAVIALRSASFDVIIDGRNVCRAHLVDIPTTLTPSSFNDLTATSSNPPTQPRSLPEPKNKGAKVPQAKDLKEIHERYGVLVKESLQAAREAGVKEWCNPRVIRAEQNDDNDMRQWHDMFSIMQSFRGGEDKTEIQLSGSGSISFFCNLI